jgi:hypothetical protein
MWLVFETLGAKPAVQVMRELFAENLHLMAEYARPWPQGKPPDLRTIRTLREKISQNFLAVTLQSDAVLFEIGRSRDQSLAVRARLRAWQPQFRSLFLMEVALSCHPHNIQAAYAGLEHAIFDAFHNEPPPRSRAVLTLDAQIIELASRLLAEIKAAPLVESRE